MIISGFCHDLDHRGMNNKFQKLLDSDLWKMYGTSTLEKHHVDMTLMLLRNSCEFLEEDEVDTEAEDPENTPMEKSAVSIISKESKKSENILAEIEKIIEHAILSTDLSIYFARKKSIEEMKERTLVEGYWAFGGFDMVTIFLTYTP